MTTIACDGKSMAGDGLVTSGGTVFGEAFVKVARLKDGRLAGASGSAFFIQPFWDWLESGGEFPQLGDDEGFDGIVLHTNGSCQSYDNKGRCIPEEVPTAVGSGRELAIGAMCAGATAEEAVAISCKRDTCTGGKITTISLK
jgi:ATP-dependent protease HslVU (ClpYQ) peptidase subunit